jgi:hypothetical protein
VPNYISKKENGENLVLHRPVIALLNVIAAVVMLIPSFENDFMQAVYSD